MDIYITPKLKYLYNLPAITSCYIVTKNQGKFYNFVDDNIVQTTKIINLESLTNKTFLKRCAFWIRDNLVIFGKIFLNSYYLSVKT